MNPTKSYDVIIIGGGPAGLTAGIYTARARLSTLLIEKMAVGGQIINSLMVENYPGYKDGVSGVDLTMAMYDQAVKFGMETLSSEVTAITVKKKKKTVSTPEGDFEAKAIIIAGGSERRKLGVPGETEYTGKGVSYCATCDGAFFRDKVVAVIGGGNSAVTEALELTRFASRVYLVHRRNELRATKILQEKMAASAQIQPVWDSVVEEIAGDGFVQKLKLKNVKSGKTEELEVSGIFVSVGTLPATGYLEGLVKLDDGNAIMVNDKLETGVPGVYAAGDIRSGSIKQVVAAAGDGAIAAVNAGKYISG